MKIFDFLEEYEEELIDGLYEDPLSKRLTELEESTENSIIEPDGFEPPEPYQPDPLALGGYESDPMSESDLGEEEGAGNYEVPVPPLRTSGGSRRALHRRPLRNPLHSGAYQLNRTLRVMGELCPIRDDNPVTFECLYCEHFLTSFAYSHCGIKEDEFLENPEESEED